MRKQVRQYLRRSLCGILSAAMILTGSSLSGLTVYAEEPEVEEGLQTNAEGGSTEETPSEETEDTTQNPDAGDGTVTDQKDDADDADADQGVSDGQEQAGDDETLSADADADAGNAGEDELEAPDAADDDVEKDIKPVVGKNGVSVMGEEDEVEQPDTYGTLVNGGFEEFEEVSTGLWAPKLWKYSPSYTGNTGDGFMVATIGTEHGTNSLKIYRNNEATDISVSQVVQNMEPGAYTVKLYTGGIYTKDQVMLKVETVEQSDENDEDYSTVSDVLVTKSLGESNDWTAWNEITTDPFLVAVPEGKTEVNVKVTIFGKIGANKEEQLNLDDITFESVSYTKEELQTLYDAAAALKESDYTSDSYKVLENAMSAAKTVLDNASAEAAAITGAYITLYAAKEALVPSVTSTEATFYYYAGETEDAVGLHCTGTNVTTTATEAGWTVESGEKVYLFTKVEGYTGWYSIPIKILSGGADSGFEIYTHQTTEATKVVSYSTTENKEVYEKLADGTNETCAYKNGISYSGKDATTELDKAAAVIRNVTFYVYSEETTPAIQLDNKSAATELAVVNEGTGEISKLPVSGQDEWKNPVWDLQKVTEKENWYSLSFSVPGEIKFDSKKIGSLNKKDSQGNYSWDKDLNNGGSEVDFSPVFSGSVYYKDGIFYKSMEDAEAVTLAQLNALLASDEVTNIVKKGASGYTEATWTVFNTAYEAAQKAAEDSKDKADDYTDTTITNAYKELKSAIGALESLGLDVTFYYYIAELEADDEVGLYHWGADLTSTAENASWNVGGADDTYLMTAVEGYAGWYSIPLSFTNNGKDAGFQIFKKSAATSETKTAEYICEASENGDAAFFAKVTSGAKDDQGVYAVKNKVGYTGTMVKSIMRQVTLYVYDATAAPYLQMGKADVKKLSVIDETTGIETMLTAETVDSENAYILEQDPDHKNWYYITFSAPGELKFDSKKICNLYINNGKAYEWSKDFMNGSEDQWGLDFTPVFDGKNYYKDGIFYATMEEADPDSGLTLLDQLQQLVEEAKQLKEADYKKGWAEFTKALTAAEAVLKAAADAETDTTKTAPTEEEIQKAYDDLKAAMDALVPASVQEADINVQKIALDDKFITGADLSSYWSLKESGTVFKDEDGNPLSDAEFFKYLYDGGTNWVRIRVWNDPYDSNGNGYGGGNNDLAKAKIMGKLATDAGMRVLIDFHYSDFWADPAKQQAPKAWKAYTIEEKEEAVKSYTLESLNALKAAGVDVGMVQVGNETNNGVCGETLLANQVRIFNAGSAAVREFDPNCLVALHFTEPQKGGFYSSLAKSMAAVDYDVFASSIYPYYHGTSKNLEDVLSEVAETGKMVMVAETSWATSWDDGDGHENTAPRTTHDLNYDISVQGQADEIRDMINAVNNVNSKYSGKGIGVFYWEPAWISPNYVYDEEGNVDATLLKQNKEAWEKYGSGWAASYASEYDPSDAGRYYGGSAIDNQAWFDFDGTALPTAKIYSLIRTGAEAERAISSVKSRLEVEIPVGGSFEYPTATAVYNDGTTEELTVTWEQDEQELVNTDRVGEYTVHGIVTKDGIEYKVTLTVKVIRTSQSNILVNPGFEEDGTGHKGWEVTGKGISSNDKDWKENVRTGTYAMHFWSEEPTTLGTFQTVKPEAGTYTFGGYIQGDGAAATDVHYAYAEVYDKDNNLKARKQVSFTLNGWMNWSEPEIADIVVEDGDSLKVGVEITATAVGDSGVWGTLDDFYLCGTHSVSVSDGIEYGTVETSVVKANSGEKVIVTVTPEVGYYLDTMTLSGASITAENYTGILSSSNGAVTFRAAGEGTTNAAVLTYAAETAVAKSDTFTMPNGNVTVSATFRSVFGEGAEKIELDAKDADGKYLVQVNANDGETPVLAQFYTGKAVTPAVELSYKGYTLTSADYKVEYSNNKNKTTGTDTKAEIKLTAKGDKFTGTRTIKFEIEDDNRNEFSAKKLKVVFEASDKNGRTDKPAQAVYYLGKEKEVVPKISLYNVGDDINDTTKAIDPKLYTVYYQNNKKVGKATLVVLPTDVALSATDGYKEGSITTTYTIAKCPVNQNSVEVTVSATPNYYTGKKVEPSVTVKYNYTAQDGTPKSVTLTKGTDYTVTYSNNVNASVYNDGGTIKNINDKKVPTLKITGKGNFSGVRSTSDLKDNGKAGENKYTFVINPRNLVNTTVTAADLARKTSAQAPKLTVQDGTKKVAASQYEITEIKRTHDADGKALAEAEVIYSKQGDTVSGTAKVTEAGTYDVKIAGKLKANYTGEATVSFHVVDQQYLIPNAKIKVSGKFYFTGNQVKLTSTGDAPDLKVTAGSATLTEQKNVDSTQDGYCVSYTNNTNAGRATITITGTGKYVGTKTATFMISKRTLAKEITKESDKDKKGALQIPKLSVKTVKENQEGEWTTLPAEAPEQQGALINSDTTDTTEYGTLAIPYTGYAPNPGLKFSSDNKGILHELSSSDYTVTYTIGKWTDGIAPVTATVKGKGNYSGSVKLQNLFTVTARSLKDFSIDVASVTYNGKALKPAVTFRNKQTGKVVDLKLNTAYSVTYKNNKDTMGVSKKQPVLTVKVKGNGWITNNDDPDTKSRELNFTIDRAEITKTDIDDVKFQSFLGKVLKPKVTVKVNGRKLKEGKDYELTYENNGKRSGTSTATVKITGKGNYFTRKPIEKTFVIK